jgi:hypothetical protein
MKPTAPNLEPVLLRIATDERFFANLYWDWCGGKLDVEAIAAALRAPIDAVVNAGLCFRPRSDDNFSSDVENIARYAGIETASLLSLVRTAEALAVFKRSPEQDRFLAAARDVKREDIDE